MAAVRFPRPESDRRRGPRQRDPRQPAGVRPGAAARARPPRSSTRSTTSSGGNGRRPGRNRCGSRARSSTAELGTLVRGRRLAVDYSPHGAIPYLDGVPAGVAELLRSLGATLVSSVELVTRYCSVMSPQDIASHQRAAETIATIAREALALAGARAATATPITEHELAVWVRERFDRAGLVTESGPSVSWGPNAARAHYEPTAEESAPIVPGALLLLDLWAKEPDGIYADQTWMAAIGSPTERDADLWTVVRDARDAALDVIESRCARARPCAVRRPMPPRGGSSAGGASGPHRRPHGALDRSLRPPRLRSADRRHRDLRRSDTDPGRRLFGGAGRVPPGRGGRTERGERGGEEREDHHHAEGVSAGADDLLLRYG